MQRQHTERISTGAKWEDIVGYSRAVKHNNIVEITGTISLDDEGNIVGTGDAGAQTRRIIEIAQNILNQFGGDLQDVIRTRIFVTNIDEWEAIGRVHGEFFSKIKPATTMVEVSRLIIPEAKVEIEFSAILD
jgi:enamine deaminase RidA (YjgF/YER057c/UK114 family)